MSLIITEGSVQPNHMYSLAAVMQYDDPLVLSAQELADKLPGIWTPDEENSNTYFEQAMRLKGLLEPMGLAPDATIDLVVKDLDPTRMSFANDAYLNSVRAGTVRPDTTRLGMEILRVTQFIGKNNRRSNPGSFNYQFDRSKHYWHYAPYETRSNTAAWASNDHNARGESAVVKFGYPVVLAEKRFQEIKDGEVLSDGSYPVQSVTTYKRTHLPMVTAEHQAALDDLNRQEADALDKQYHHDDNFGMVGAYDDIHQSFNRLRSVIENEL
jgi:hypothetical protein